MGEIRIQDQNPTKIMYGGVKRTIQDSGIYINNILPKDNSSTAINTPSTTEWQINDDWEIEIVDSKKFKIKKFKVDTWGLRQIIPNPHNTYPNYDNMRINVTGLDYVHKNVVCHTAGSDIPDGFTKAYGGTYGYNIYWHPGQFTSGNSMQGLVIQFGIGYAASTNEANNGLQIGKHPWDVGTKVGITDGVIIGSRGDGTYKAITIGLYGGVQNATAWNDENGEAFRVYNISDHPIIVTLDAPDMTELVDPTTDQCFDAYVGDTNVYHKERNIQNCWIDYGLATISEKVCNLKLGSTNLLPDVVDIEPHILPAISSDTYAINWSGCNNQIILDRVVQYFKTHPWIAVNDKEDNYSNYTGKDNNIRNVFTNIPLTIKHLHIKIDGNQIYMALISYFSGTHINKLTLQFMQDNVRISSAQRLFFKSKIDEIEILDKNGNLSYNVNKFFLAAFDCSGMYEQTGGSLKVFPPIINWNRVPKYTTNIGWMFSYAGKIEEIQECSLYARESPVNTIKVANLQQAFEYCGRLRRIGPRLDMRAVTPGDDTFRAFTQCTQLEDVLIYGLNAGTWKFNDNSLEGMLNNLNQDSMNYLFNNLLDLTTYNELTAVQTVNNSWEHESWSIGSSGAILNHEDVFTQTRYPNGQRTPFISTSAQLTNMQIRVRGLIEQDILILPDGREITEDGIYTISTEGGSQVGFSLVNTGITESQVSDDIVDLFIVNPYYSTNIHGDSGSIYFPEQKQCTITSEMVEQAKQKGWTIYVNNVEQ